MSQIPIITKATKNTQHQRLLSMLSAQQVEISEGPSIKPLTVAALEKCFQLAKEEDCSFTLNHLKQDAEQIILDVSGLNRIEKIQAEELLLTTQTGCFISEINKTLAPHQLQLALNWPQNTSLMTALSKNHTGFSNYHHHHELAHWVTGIEAITGQGQLIQYGGEVMKNVTGYDLTRLFCGSHNQFGIITSCTLKLMPMPKARHLSLWHFDQLDHAIGFIRQMAPKSIVGLEIASLFKVKPLFGYKLLIKLTGEPQDIENNLQLLNQLYDLRAKSLPVEELPVEQELDWVEKLFWPALPQQQLPSTPHSAVFFEVALPYGNASQMDLWLASTSDVLEKSDWVWNIAQDELYFRIQKQADFPLQAAQTLRHTLEVKGATITPFNYPNEDWAKALADQLLTPINPIELKWLERMKNQWDPKAILPFAPVLQNKF